MRFGVFVADFEATFDRAILAIVAGAGAGAVIVNVLFAFVGFFTRSRYSFMLIEPSFFMLVFMTIIGFMCWIGAPIWFCLDRARLRGWGAALSCGAAATMALYWMFAPLISLGGTPSGAHWHVLLIFVAVGGPVSLVIWAVAYRRPAPPPSADAAR